MPGELYGSETLKFLIAGSNWLEVTRGADLYDADGNFIEDITEDVRDWSIEHNNFREVHGLLKIQFTRDLQWEVQEIHPYIKLSNSYSWWRWNMGAFAMNTPGRQIFETPQQFECFGYDRLWYLDTPAGVTYQAKTGDNVITKVEGILTSLGYSHDIDQTESSTTMATNWTWTIDVQNTWLRIINDMLRSINYFPLFCDRNGVFTSEKRVLDTLLPSMWTYDSQPVSNYYSEDAPIMAEDVFSQTDLHDVPNKWVFVDDDPERTNLPSEGDGLYTVTNQSDGPASIDSRGGRVKTMVHKIMNIPSHAKLVERGDQIVSETKLPLNEIRMTIGINPEHWHYDAVTVNMPEIGISNQKYTVYSWKLPFFNADQQIRLRRYG